VKEAKRKYVAKLMDYFEMPSDEDTKRFYDDVLRATEADSHSVDESMLEYADSDAD